MPLSVVDDFGVFELYRISLSTRRRTAWDSSNPTAPAVLMRLLDLLLDDVADDMAIVEKSQPGTLKTLIRLTEDIEQKVGLSALSFDPLN